MIGCEGSAVEPRPKSFWYLDRGRLHDPQLRRVGNEDIVHCPSHAFKGPLHMHSYRRRHIQERDVGQNCIGEGLRRVVYDTCQVHLDSRPNR